MKKEDHIPYKFSSLTEAHRMMGLPQPKHPLISLINNEDHPVEMNGQPNSHILNFYKISYKPKLSGRLKYGQSYYDFDEGGLLFAAPNQIIGHEEDLESSVCSLFTLLIHPDFLLSYPIAKKIKSYGFFSYSTNEALHLSEKEKATIITIFKSIEEELNSRIDDFSQDVMITQIELLLNYSNRFYKRQFITRKVLNSDLLQKLEELLEAYFNDRMPMLKGLPTVQYLSDHLNVSPSYLSDLLRSLTGQNAQQHIHQKLIEKAKEKLSATSLTVSEVAYELGFEHSQSFNKLFKAKTKISPLAFRKMFN
ncbi:helix-turn-helix domain-containing protein [Pedobacter miscanthi]|uniref:AraC family transcriptional regulator n=1 Tax=Pedobacter miscanthi TaxID=2259170 RepID=A0A366KMZ3_9SPHI|nr:helix-turn-helix domain-containing protein [Pedobacter miscanthi]RBQ03015.1 AraC family transcriptional regulator [Pedobacter miscanthi]